MKLQKFRDAKKFFKGCLIEGFSVMYYDPHRSAFTHDNENQEINFFVYDTFGNPELNNFEKTARKDWIRGNSYYKTDLRKFRLEPDCLYFGSFKHKKTKRSYFRYIFKYNDQTYYMDLDDEYDEGIFDKLLKSFIATSDSLKQAFELAIKMNRL